MLIFSLLIVYIIFLVKMKEDDVDGAYNCQQQSVKEVIACDICMEWFQRKNLVLLHLQEIK